jgi:eukaryotic-like serine/threonine-protein kinase
MARDDPTATMVARLQGLRRPGETPAFDVLLARDPQLARQLEDNPLLRDEVAAYFHSQRVVDTDSNRDLRSARILSPQVNGYELYGVIGRGAMGVVYRGRQLSVDRPVAVKILSVARLGNPAAVARFRREADVAGKLSHPNIVQVYDAGTLEGVPYIIQELVDGPNLAQKVDGKPLACSEAAGLLQSLASAVGYAHERGIVHRDLKPTNVLVAAEGALKIADFGLARFVAGDDLLTKTGEIAGTPRYMAPEQAAGSIEIGPAADIYSLGVILYELLSGRPPIEGQSDIDTLKRVATAEPAPLRQSRPDVPRDLEAICLKCLEKEPRHRYAMAQRLADDLERFLKGAPVVARPVSPLVQTMRRWQRQPRVVKLVLGISLALWMLAAAGLWIFVMTRNPAHDAAPALPAAGLKPRTQAQYESDIAEAYKIWRTSPLRFDDHRDIGDEMERLLARHLPEAEEKDRRGFEWHYLWKLAHPERYALPLPELFELRGHSDIVYFVTFSANGSRIATAGKDRTARVWDAKTGRQVCLCKGHTDEVNWVDFSPDGNLVATAGDDRLVKLWEAESGKELATLRQHAAPVIAVGFCPTRAMLASADKKGMLILWDIGSKRSIRSVQAHPLDIQALAWSPDGQWILTAGGGDRIKIWDANNLRVRREFVDGAASAVFNEDASLIASGSMGRSGVMIDDVQTGRRRMVLMGHTDRVQSVRFAPDGLGVASCSNDGSVRAWDLMTRHGWHLKRTVPGHPYWCVAFSPDGTRLAACGDNKLAQVGDTSVGIYWTYLELEGNKHSPKDLTFGPSSDSLATVWADNSTSTGLLKLWNLTHQPPTPGIHDDGAFHSVALSPKSQELALALNRGIRLVETVGDQHERRRLQTPTGAAEFLRFSNDGRELVAVAGPDPVPQWSVTRWNVETGRETWNFNVPRNEFATIAFSADDQLFAISRLDGRVELFDASSAARIKVLESVRGPGHCLAFSPTQRRLASGTDDGVRVWDLETNHIVSTLRTEHQSVDQIVYFPDGTRLATVSRSDRTIRIWSISEGSRELLTLPLPPQLVKHGRIGQLAISPDGGSIACFGTAIDGTWGVYLWQTSPPGGPLDPGRN